MAGVAADAQLDRRLAQAALRPRFLAWLGNRIFLEYLLITKSLPSTLNVNPDPFFNSVPRCVRRGTPVRLQRHLATRQNIHDGTSQRPVSKSGLPSDRRAGSSSVATRCRTRQDEAKLLHDSVFPRDCNCPLTSQSLSCNPGNPEKNHSNDAFPSDRQRAAGSIHGILDCPEGHRTLRHVMMVILSMAPLLSEGDQVLLVLCCSLF